MIKVLMHPDDLRVGHRITGPAYLHIWVVWKIGLGEVYLHRGTTEPCREMQHDFETDVPQTGWVPVTECVKCGMRCIDTNRLLSKSEDSPRTVILNA